MIAVTSGKGGVGKSVISSNLATAMAASGRRVLLVDADLALANLDLMLGVSARYTIRDILDESTSIQDAVVTGPNGVRLLAACSGDHDIADMQDGQRMALFSAIDSLEDDFDTVIVDTGAGVGSNATGFASAAQQVLVVVTPDPASMADAYAMIKVLNQRHGVKRVHLVVNMATGPREAENVVSKIVGLAGRFLDLLIVPVGYIYRDEAVERSVRRCSPVVCSLPAAPVAGSMRALASRILEERPDDSYTGGPMLFWKRLMGVSNMERQ